MLGRNDRLACAEILRAVLAAGRVQRELGFLRPRRVLTPATNL